MSIFLDINEAQLLKAQTRLRVFQEPKMTSVLRKAALAGARAIRPMLRAAAPRNRNVPQDYPRDLRGSIKVAYSRKSGKLGGVAYVVGPMGNKAFHRHWVIKGTKLHRITAAGPRRALRTPYGPRHAVQHPGGRANPFVARVGLQARGPMKAAMLASIAKSIREGK